MIEGYGYATGAVGVLVVVGVSFWAGVRFESAGHAAELVETANAYAESANANFEALRAKLEAAESRASDFERQRTHALSRAKELEREIASLPRRPSGDFTDDELQAFTRLHEQYFGAAPSPDGMPDSLLGSSASRESSPDVRSSGDAVDGGM